MINLNRAAELLGYHPQSIRDLVRLGKLPGVKKGWYWMFDKEELLALQEISDRIGSTVSKVYLTQKLSSK